MGSPAEKPYEKRMKKKLKFRHLVEAIIIWALPFSLRPLPFAIRVRVGGVFVGGAIRLIPSLRKRIQDNLSLIYPNMQPDEKKALYKSISKNIGERFIEAFYNQEFDKWIKNLRYADDAFDKIIEAQEAGHPVILVSGHLGQLQAPRVVLANLGHPSAAIYKENANPIFEGRHRKNMTYPDAPFFATGPAGMRKMLKHLKSGGMVSVLLDQRANDGELIDFMGKASLTSTAMASLAIRTNALMIPVYSVVRSDKSGTDIYVEAPIKHTDPLQMTQEFNDSLSARVWKNPEQWYWLHKRWARPDLQE